MRTFILSLFLIAATFTSSWSGDASSWSKDNGEPQKRLRVKVRNLRVSIPRQTDVSEIPVQTHSEKIEEPAKNRLGRVRGFMIDDDSDNEDDNANNADSKCAEMWGNISLASLCVFFAANLFKMYMLN